MRLASSDSATGSNGWSVSITPTNPRCSSNASGRSRSPPRRCCRPRSPSAARISPSSSSSRSIRTMKSLPASPARPGTSRTASISPPAAATATTARSSQQVTAILAPPATINGESSEDVFTWSVAPRFEFTDQSSLYARVAKGYRPGGPNVVPPGAPPNFLAAFEADTLISYELGLRAETPDRLFSIDVAAYRLDWENILINTVFIDPATGTQFGANGNGRRARSQGFDLDRDPEADAGPEGRAYGRLHRRQAARRHHAGAGRAQHHRRPRGDRLPYTPEFAATLAVDYEWALTESAEAYVGANLRVVDDQVTGFSQQYRAAFGRLARDRRLRDGRSARRRRFRPILDRRLCPEPHRLRTGWSARAAIRGRSRRSWAATARRLPPLRR